MRRKGTEERIRGGGEEEEERRRWEEEKNRTEEKERTEEMRIGNDCLERREWERKGRGEEYWEEKRTEDRSEEEKSIV